MKTLTLSLLTALSLQALTLDEALERTLAHSHELQRQQAATEEKAAAYDASFAAYKPTLDLKYSYTRSNRANFIGSQSDSSASLELGYNLFNGFADKYGIEIAQLSVEQARHEFDAAVADRLLAVKQAYIGVLRREKSLEVAKESLALLDRQLADATLFYEQGLTAKNDYLQVELEQLDAKQALLSAQSELRLAKERLRRELAGQYDPKEPLRGLNDAAHTFERTALEEAMFAQRSELLALQTQYRQSQAFEKQLESSYYPVIDTTAKYQKAGTEPWPDGGQNFKSNDESSINLSLTWHLYAGGADEAARRSVYARQNGLRHAIEQLKLELALQLETALERYQLAEARIAVAQKGLEQAKEHYRITKNQYDAQIADTALLLDAKRAMTRTQSDYVAAYFDLFEAAAVIERVTQQTR